MFSVNPSAQDCYQVLQRLCGPFINNHENTANDPDMTTSTPVGFAEFGPTEESPQTQINNIYAMMWPNANAADTDLLMQDGEWMSFLPGIAEPEGLKGDA